MGPVKPSIRLAVVIPVSVMSDAVGMVLDRGGLTLFQAVGASRPEHLSLCRLVAGPGMSGVT
jgi:hypothetical protein